MTKPTLKGKKILADAVRHLYINEPVMGDQFQPIMLMLDLIARGYTHWEDGIYLSEAYRQSLCINPLFH